MYPLSPVKANVGRFADDCAKTSFTHEKARELLPDPEIGQQQEQQQHQRGMGGMELYHGSTFERSFNIVKATGKKLSQVVDTARVKDLQPILRKGVLSYLNQQVRPYIRLLPKHTDADNQESRTSLFYLEKDTLRSFDLL